MHVWIVFTFGSTLSHSTLNVLGRKWSKHWLGVINWLWSIVLVFSPPPVTVPLFPVMSPS